jgi:hypothetical protein|tara:strand:- start:70 stop:372 length:303 start_codon:yes stop_codon:yes gene_type:complete
LACLIYRSCFLWKCGQSSFIPKWVDAYGDECFHHIAILVEEIVSAVKILKLKNSAFAEKIIEDPGSDLRQIFTVSEMKNGKIYSVLGIIERHNGYMGFIS